MKESLKTFLMERCGFTEADIEKMEQRHEAPRPDMNSLRKSFNNQMEEHDLWIRAGTAMTAEVHKDLAEIKESLAAIAKADATLAAAARGRESATIRVPIK
jgi:hypothetical protein